MKIMYKIELINIVYHFVNFINNENWEAWKGNGG